jgi:hypothetical protein
MTPMRLTDEQHQLIEAAQGKPVEVLDPQTSRAYVLLSQEVYQRLRDLVGWRFAPPLPEGSEAKAMRVKLRDLPMASEVAERVQKRCRELGFSRRRYVQEIEEEAKLQYHFGGQYVGYLRTDEGGVIVAATDQPDSDAFQQQLACVSPEELLSGRIHGAPLPLGIGSLAGGRDPRGSGHGRQV